MADSGATASEDGRSSDDASPGGTSSGEASPEPGSEGAADPSAASASDASLLRRALQALGLTLLVLALAEFLAFAALQDAGLYRLVGVLLLAELAVLLAASLYLRWSLVRPDWPLPGRTDGAPAYRGLGPWVVLTGSVGLAAFALVTQGLARLAGVEFVPGSPADTGVASETALLAALPIAVLVAAPIEELFFRGVVQTHLRGATSARGAVGGAAALFALAHVPGYLAMPSAAGVVLATLVVFVAGLVVGAAYERTGSLGVAVGIHAGYNLIVVGGTYLVLLVA